MWQHGVHQHMCDFLAHNRTTLFFIIECEKSAHVSFEHSSIWYYEHVKKTTSKWRPRSSINVRMLATMKWQNWTLYRRMNHHIRFKKGLQKAVLLWIHHGFYLFLFLVCLFDFLIRKSNHLYLYVSKWYKNYIIIRYSKMLHKQIGSRSPISHCWYFINSLWIYRLISN